MSTIPEQLPEFIRQMSAALRAGHSVKQIIDQQATATPAPLGAEIQQIKADLESGVPMPAALKAWTQRAPSEDLNWFVATCLVQVETGGNLADKIDLLNAVMEKRKALAN